MLLFIFGAQIEIDVTFRIPLHLSYLSCIIECSYIHVSMKTYSEDIMTLTMKEIARLADVSQPTVSRVINNNPNVNPEIAAKVRSVIEQYGFVPNKSAQTLKRSDSHLIGISVVNISNPYFMELIEALEKECREHGYSIILQNSQHDALLEQENMANFVARQADGILLVPTDECDLAKFRSIPVPIIIITLIKDLFDSVAISHQKGGALVAEHFIKQGHYRFAFIGPQNDEKFQGFQEGLYANGYNFDRDNMIELAGNHNSQYQVRQCIANYLDSHPVLNFTSVFCYNDLTAVEFIKQLEERGLSSSQFAIAGFDDTILAKTLAMTSVHQPITDMAKQAFQLLVQKINQNEPHTEPSRILLLDPQLVVRASTLNKPSEISLGVN